MKWDRRKKRFTAGIVTGADNKRIIRTENGTQLPASYRSGRFDKWRKSSGKSLDHSDSPGRYPSRKPSNLSRSRIPRITSVPGESSIGVRQHRPGKGLAGSLPRATVALSSSIGQRKSELKSSLDIVRSRRGNEKVRQARLYLLTPRHCKATQKRVPRRRTSFTSRV